MDITAVTQRRRVLRMGAAELANGVRFIRLARRGSRGNKCWNKPLRQLQPPCSTCAGNPVEDLFPLPPLRANLMEQRKPTNGTGTWQSCLSSASRRLGGE